MGTHTGAGNGLKSIIWGAEPREVSHWKDLLANNHSVRTERSLEKKLSSKAFKSPLMCTANRIHDLETIKREIDRIHDQIGVDLVDPPRLMQFTTEELSVCSLIDVPFFQ